MFSVLELEAAEQKKKDTSSQSRITCGRRCVKGPKAKSRAPCVTNTVILLMVALNILSVVYSLQGEWIWLTTANIVLGLIVTILMWCVQCSDPGILSRDQNEQDL